MKAYKLELIVVDYDDFGEDEIVSTIEDSCENWGGIVVMVTKVASAEIGEWSDDHPLNHKHTAAEYIKEKFKNE